MKHQIKTRYPAPSAVVLKMFTDHAFHVAKMEALDVIRYEVLENSFDGKEFQIRIERRIPMQVPGVIKKFFPAQTTAINEERWTLASKSGRVKAEAVGVPIDMACVATMADEAAGCVITYDWEIKARVPLIGGALEKFVVLDLDARWAEEARIAVPMLDRYR